MEPTMTSTTGPRNSAGGGESVARRRWSELDVVGGFTLLELIVVLVVISIVLAISSPSLRGFFASRQTADAAAKILALTKWARSEAVCHGRVCRLNFDAGSGTFWLTVQDSGRFVELGSEMGQHFQAPEGAVISLRDGADEAAVSYIQFYPNGRSDALSVQITGRGGEVFQVACPSAAEAFRVISPSEAQSQ